MYKYLLFDLDDTLLDFKKAEETAIKTVLADFNIAPTDENILLYSKINDTYWKRFERGEIEKSEIFKNRFKTLAQELKVMLPVETVSRRYFEELSKCGFVFDGAGQMLKYLYNSHVICAATNGELNTQKSRIKKSGLEKYFNGGIFISEQVGFQKPNAEYFEFILDKLKNPEKKDVLVIGDSPSSDILGANNAGLDSCFINFRGNVTPEGINPTYSVTSYSELVSIVSQKRPSNSRTDMF